MRKYEVTGITGGRKGTKVTRTIEADNKQSIWNNPSIHGFSKLFSVKDVKEVMHGSN